MKKLAFLFFCKNSINKIDIWKKYFENNYDKCNIYIHCYDRENIQCEFVKKYLCDKLIPSKWGNILYISQYHLKNALLDVDNYKFITITESCVPLKTFDYTYNLLMSNDKTFMGYLTHLAKNDNHKSSLLMQYRRYINNSKFRNLLNEI